MTPVANLVVVFESRFGQARTIAERIGALARARGVSASVVRASEVRAAELRDAHAVILVAPVYDGKFPEPIRTLVRANAPSLAARRTGFFTVSLGSAARFRFVRRGIEKLSRDFLEKASWSPDVTASFGGGLAYPAYDSRMRFMMSLSARFFGLPTDTSRTHELTDWAAVERATFEVLGEPRATDEAIATAT